MLVQQCIIGNGLSLLLIITINIYDVNNNTEQTLVVNEHI